MAPDPKLSGHLGHLTSDQEAKLRDFWAIIFTSVASVLSAVYEVTIPDGPPSKIFEILDKINEPTVDAITSALKGITIQESNGTSAETNGDANGHTNGETNGEAPEAKAAKAALTSDKSNQKVAPEHFASLLAELRKLGVQDAEIKSMESILSQMTPKQMCFYVLKMVKQEHPDSLLLRFLRARKFDVGKAFSMMASTILWRKEMEVDDEILPHGEAYALEMSRGQGASVKEKKEGADFINQLKMGKSFLHGFDREGRPVNYVRVKIHKPGAQSEETIERYIVHVIESTRLIIAPPVETGTIVFDMTGFGLSNMEYGPVKFIIKCFEANYPESLGLLLIHNAPWVFSGESTQRSPREPRTNLPGIWRLIQGWLDPVVASKIQFTKSVADLDKYIPRNQIPKELKGDEDWNYKYIEPVENENAAIQDTETRDSLMVERTMIATRLLGATAAWISATTSNEEASKVEEIKSRRNAVVEEFRMNYWKLDPHIRARALIDRDGMLLPGGQLSRGVIEGLKK
ncbi:unnamed protein product [Penicillium salamii]|uniref:CRAL-TRIO domain-containing protein n=1 Tax=Penicillium salamii TaxID=1612424 RepID=A0A9W4IU77_9EURO|nr:unnamed protein product [Penicillium salamii]CAG8023251.1 unnamed protein product [Penicillium salamii]CAG8214557.1 unnamed protein product [Penicillium salamii]CAG8301718.1 unnamed protein product [Penicillium salamii]CAG8324008.1 unnamed protein product [Penicillium salamii]